VLTASPIFVAWNYTYACNFNCIHCYSRARSYPRELDTADYRAIADQLADVGVLRVALGGGEPMTRRDYLEILSRMGERYIDTYMTTNAWFLTEETAKRLVDARLGMLFVSLDASAAAVHDEFRRRSGSFDRVVSGMKAAVKAGLKVKLSTVITRMNFYDLPKIVMVAEQCGVEGISFKRFKPVGNGHAAADILSLQGGQHRDVQSLVAELNDNSPLDIALFYNAEADGDVDFGCDCGIRSLTLRPNGDIAPCGFAGIVIGNIKKDNIGSLWRESPVLARMRAGERACAGLKPDKSPLGEGYAHPPRHGNLLASGASPEEGIAVEAAAASSFDSQGLSGGR
jgi:AdoMet-dependent heme synthase